MMIAMLASIPSPSANSISLGPLSLNAYGLMIALGVLAAVWMLGRQLESKGLGSTDDASSIGMWGVAAGIVGARLYHVITDWDRFSDDLAAIPKIWEGGLGIPGGLLAGVAVGVWQGRKRGIAPGQLLSCAAPAIPLAQAIGRWGNWFNQELFGKATDLPWGLEIDDAHTPAGYASDTTFHPTFLYESLWNLGLVALLLWIDRKFRLGPGRLFAVYVMGYGVGRYWIEGLRIDAVQLSDVAGLRWNQWVALAAIVGGALYLVATRGRRWPEPVPADDEPDSDSGDRDGEDGEPHASADEAVIDEAVIDRSAIDDGATDGAD
jgi:phosphatidylglycerol---prolipoprotein diacylglyceryl transferase